MPRIRMLKPEHRLHRKVGGLDDQTYRLWISLIMEADDEGRFVANARQLAAQTWGLHLETDLGKAGEVAESCLLQLRSLRLIALYRVSGIRYGYFPSWHDHQKPKYPTPSKLPIPPGLGKASPNPSGASPPSLPYELNRVELNRTESNRDGKGRVREGEPRSVAHATNGTPTVDEMAEHRAKQERARELLRSAGLTPPAEPSV